MDAGTILSFSIFVLACAAAAVPGLVIRPGRWYRALAKPAWRPPDRVFGPVWLVLYVSIAVSGWLVWRQAPPETVVLPLSVYAAQLALNGLWSVVFFGLRRPDLAFVEIICLWLSILATMAVFHPIDEVAAYLLIPYASWVAFAALLNFRIWRLNPAHASW